VYAAIGLIVHFSGTAWVERLMPPVLTGAIVGAIGLNLAGVAVKGVSASGFDTAVGLFTVLAVALIAVHAPGMARRLPVLLGAICGYLVYLICANGFGFGKPIDFSAVAAAPLFGLPHFTGPVFTGTAMALIAPVAIVLVAENLGHVKAISAMTGRDFDPILGRAFLADGLATIIAGFGGGHRGDHLRREHGRHGGDPRLLHPGLRRRRLCRAPARLLAEIRRLDLNLTGAGDRRAGAGRLRPHCRDRRPHLG
jgi:putative pyrimidine permease RutG